jgi:hypothetical protein
MSLHNARIAVLLTGFIAFTSILVAGMLAMRLDRTRGALQQRLAECPCCQDLRPGAQGAAP